MSLRYAAGEGDRFLLRRGVVYDVIRKDSPAIDPKINRLAYSDYALFS